MEPLAEDGLFFFGACLFVCLFCVGRLFLEKMYQKGEPMKRRITIDIYRFY